MERRKSCRWNVRDAALDWRHSLTDINTPCEGDALRFYKGDWQQTFERDQGKYFTTLEQSRFDYVHKGSPQQRIMDRFISVSFIAALSPEANARVRRQIAQLIASHPDLCG